VGWVIGDRGFRSSVWGYPRIARRDKEHCNATQGSWFRVWGFSCGGTYMAAVMIGIRIFFRSLIRSRILGQGVQVSGSGVTPNIARRQRSIATRFNAKFPDAAL
jgi:hypothetical protein